MTFLDRLLHRNAVPSAEAEQAMADSAERAERSKRFLADIEQQVEPLRQVLERNHFEPAVRAMFMRRPV